jgi:translation initiation factor eIF-2B subunit epsilon
MIFWTLEFLAHNGIRDVYIYCTPHSTEVEQFIENSQYMPPKATSPFDSITFIHSVSRSYGDAMRTIDERNFITGDFLLLHGDFVGNYSIGPALDRHRARRAKSKDAIMTTITKKLQGPHRLKKQGVTQLWCVQEDHNNRIVHYGEETDADESNKWDLFAEVMMEYEDFELLSELLDPGLDICTPDVLALWSESFDAEHPRTQFLHNMLKDYELNGKTFHMEIIPENTGGYVARADTLAAYTAVQRDIMARYTYPFIPETNLFAGQKYTMSRQITKENGVVLARSCAVGKRCCIGANTSIGEGTTVRDTIIGRRCIIGNNVTITNSYIWNDVVIGDGATIDNCIIANEAVIGKGATLSPASLISFRVKIADNFVVPKFSKLTRAKRARIDDYEDDEAAELEEVASDPAAVGEGGEGYKWEDPDHDDEDKKKKLFSEMLYDLDHLGIQKRRDSISTIHSHDDDTLQEGDRSRLSSFADTVSDDEMSGDEGAGHAFHKDAVADVFKTLAEKGDFGNTRVEFTSLRLSNNASDHHVHRAIASGYSKHIAVLIENGADPAAAVKSTLAQDGALDFLSDVAIGRGRDLEDQVDFLLCLQKDLCHREKGEVVLFQLCRQLYDLDVLEEEGFEAWWDNAKSSETEEMEHVRKLAGTFVAWLAEAEEEDSDEEEEEEESSEEE